MGIVSLLYPSNKALETIENNRTSGSRTSQFSVSLCFIALSQQILVSSPAIFNHLVGKEHFPFRLSGMNRGWRMTVTWLSCCYKSSFSPRNVYNERSISIRGPIVFHFWLIQTHILTSTCLIILSCGLQGGRFNFRIRRLSNAPLTRPCGWLS